MVNGVSAAKAENVVAAVPVVRVVQVVPIPGNGEAGAARVVATLEIIHS